MGGNSIKNLTPNTPLQEQSVHGQFCFIYNPSRTRFAEIGFQTIHRAVCRCFRWVFPLKVPVICVHSEGEMFLIKKERNFPTPSHLVWIRTEPAVERSPSGQVWTWASPPAFAPPSARDLGRRHCRCSPAPGAAHPAGPRSAAHVAQRRRPREHTLPPACAGSESQRPAPPYTAPRS